MQTHTRTYTHLNNLCSLKLCYSLCPCILSYNVYDPFSKACAGIWWSVSFQVCRQTCNLTVWVMLPTDSLPTGSLFSPLLCPLPMDRNDWWSPLLIYQIIDLLWHRFLIKLSLSKICSGCQGCIRLKHCFCWGVNLAFKFFFSIDFFSGKLVPYVQQNLADPYVCDKGKRQCYSKKILPVMLTASWLVDMIKMHSAKSWHPNQEKMVLRKRI